MRSSQLCCAENDKKEPEREFRDRIPGPGGKEVRKPNIADRGESEQTSGDKEANRCTACCHARL
jgi:hypothetical protein